VGLTVVVLMIITGVFLVIAGMRGLNPSRVAPARSPRLHDQRELVEGIAVFAELLRDSVSAAAGLEQALAITAEACPACLEPQVRRLVARLQYGRVDDALRQFSAEVGHPSCDFLVAALLMAVSHQTRDLGSLLGQLSESAREECRLYLRVWVSRARTRTAVRIISVSLVAFVAGLFLLSPGYLQAYRTLNGLGVLGVVAFGFVSGLVMLDRMARFTPPARLITERSGK
jgi:Flp pilus assembly protein TadB